MVKGRSGQALVVVLLVLAVMLTVGLSVVSNSIQDAGISQKEEEAARAFSAAEAGVEQALIGSSATSNNNFNGAGYNFATRPLAQSGDEFIFPTSFVAGETGTVWLVPHDTNNALVTGCTPAGTCFDGASIKACWGNEGDDAGSLSVAALEVAVVYLEGGSYKIARSAIDPYNGPDGERLGNFFGPPAGSTSCLIDDHNFPFSHQVNFPPSPSRPIAMRMKMHYIGNTPTKMGVSRSDGDTTSTLPAQGIVVESVGVYGNSTQKVEVTQLYPDAPSIFDYALFSGTGGLKKGN